MGTPGYISLDGMPADTVDLTVDDKASFIITAGGPGELVPALVLNTRELGWYRVAMDWAVFLNLVGQLDYFKTLGPDQLGQIIETLHRREAEPEEADG